MCVYIGGVQVSSGSEYTEANVDLWLNQLANETMSWLSLHVPTATVITKINHDQRTLKIYYDWWIKFPNQETKVYFLLANDIT